MKTIDLPGIDDEGRASRWYPVVCASIATLLAAFGPTTYTLLSHDDEMYPFTLTVVSGLTPYTIPIGDEGVLRLWLWESLDGIYLIFQIDHPDGAGDEEIVRIDRGL